MSERNGFAPGVPCWVASVFADPESAVGFYTDLFGWQAEDTMPPGSPGRYYVGRLRGRDVAAIGTASGGAKPPTAAWDTYLWVESADETATRVREAGGSVLVDPFDLLDSARMAVVADPSGAVVGLWQPRGHQGAQLVNEPGAWAMSALNVPDPEAVKPFYGAVFGWEADTLDLGETQVTLWRLPGFEGGEPQQPVPRDVIATMTTLDSDDVPASWSVDFWVHDVDATTARATELGGRVVVPPYDIPVANLRQGVLADPEGAVFSVTRAPTGS